MMIFLTNALYGTCEVLEVESYQNLIVYNDVSLFVTDSIAMSETETSNYIIAVKSNSDLTKIIAKLNPAMIDTWRVS